MIQIALTNAFSTVIIPECTETYCISITCFLFQNAQAPMKSSLKSEAKHDLGGGGGNLNIGASMSDIPLAPQHDTFEGGGKGDDAGVGEDGADPSFGDMHHDGGESGGYGEPNIVPKDTVPPRPYETVPTADEGGWGMGVTGLQMPNWGWNWGDSAEKKTDGAAPTGFGSWF